MSIALLTFAAIFVLIASAGLLVFYRGDLGQRLSAAISPRSEQKRLQMLELGRAGASFRRAIQPLERIVPRSAQEISVIQKRLTRAGYREESHLQLFYAAKVMVPVSLALMLFVTGVVDYTESFFVYVMALGLGYLLPDFWLGNRIKKRQLEIRLALPDFLDLMVVCIEAGLSLDQAVMRSIEEMATTLPTISDEFGLVQLEQRAGRPRLDCWKNLAERVDMDVIRTLVASIVQADQFGTSIAKTLRVYSDTLRVQRRQRVEELAAKTAVKLIFPLVLFIFPSLFIVVLGPASLSMAESFEKYFN